MEHPSVLPWVLLLKPEPGAGEAKVWRYAVCGTGCTELFGMSYQGKLFGESLPPAAAAQRKAEFDRAIVGGGPQFSHTNLPMPEKDFMKVYRGVFPFSTRDGEIDRILVVLARDDTRLEQPFRGGPPGPH
jgi:hypothetical protein